MTNPEHSFAASISDELNNTSDALQTLHDYANNNRIKQSHNTDSDTPRFTLATAQGNVISVWPTSNETFSVDIGFEDKLSEYGRFRACHKYVDLKEIESLVSDDWHLPETLRFWQPNKE
ncbi:MULTISPECIES: hypothetical protein [unclassified Pseudoalteromonas]|uniref:hypothetical protein n=1 Tax=unclassified Pseudoalteromonas TaxID=194690 RepID=UPI0005A744DB|nr:MULTISPECIES: hypothetical protein [unclassified Pseudoalteromonas]